MGDFIPRSTSSYRWIVLLSFNMSPSTRLRSSTTPSSRALLLGRPKDPGNGYRSLDRHISPECDRNVAALLGDPASCYGTHKDHDESKEPSVANRVCFQRRNQSGIGSEVVDHCGNHKGGHLQQAQVST